MTDIVERLRLCLEAGESPRGDLHIYAEAADEIERLRADLNQAESNGIEFEMQRDKALAEAERLTALHEIAAVRASVAQIEVEQLQEENMFLRSLVADRLRALNPAKNKRAKERKS